MTSLGELNKTSPRLPSATGSVSILMLVHNHGSFLREAIGSVLAQVVHREAEILIGEDASSDDSLAICREFEQANPGRVRVLAHKKNLGMHGNFAALWQAAQGDYIAFCEGDDYWCQPDKLEMQAAFLDAQPDYTLCGAKTRVIREDADGEWRETGLIQPHQPQPSYGFADLIPDYAFHFSSVMVRKAAVNFPPWFTCVYCVDRPLYLLATSAGHAGWIPTVLSTYRLHGGGSWSPARAQNRAQKSTHLFDTLITHFDSRYSHSFNEALADILWSYMSEAANAGDLADARCLLWRSVRRMCWRSRWKKSRLLARVVVRLYLHRLFSLLRAPNHG